MKAVKPESIASVLYKEVRSTFVEAKRQGISEIGISYSTFEGIMIRTGTLNDPATIRAKWRALISMEVIRPRDPVNGKYGKASINIAKFGLLCPISSSPYDAREIDREIEIDMCGEGY
jgi:hypothetical protein|nr:MAG TPA: hypothetical protein [Caudoviricetes sp.]